MNRKINSNNKEVCLYKNLTFIEQLETAKRRFSMVMQAEKILAFYKKLKKSLEQ